MRSERGIELSGALSSRLKVIIEMPSGATSIPHSCIDDGAALKLMASWTNQMKVWSRFEAWLVLFEDNKEISREHIKT